MSDPDLSQQLAELNAKVDALLRRQNRMAEILFGDPDELVLYDPPEGRSIAERLNAIETDVSDVQHKTALVSRDGGADTPDARAQRLRQVLYNDAKGNGGKASLTRSNANSALGGGYHKVSVLEAMKRAADGDRADINGSSHLQPVDGIEFRKGNNTGKPSVITIDLDDVTVSGSRHILTTASEGEGGT